MTVLNKNPSPNWGERCLTRFHPDLYPRLKRSRIHLFRPITGSTVNPTRRALGWSQTSPYRPDPDQTPCPIFRGHAHGWFSLGIPKETFSRWSPISSGRLPVTRPGRRDIKISELYYLFSEYQDAAVRLSKAERQQHPIPFSNRLSHVKLYALHIIPALSHEGVFLWWKN
jgi:hypothetical protein